MALNGRKCMASTGFQCSLSGFHSGFKRVLRGPRPGEEAGELEGGGGGLELRGEGLLAHQGAQGGDSGLGWSASELQEAEGEISRLFSPSLTILKQLLSHVEQVFITL